MFIYICDPDLSVYDTIHFYGLILQATNFVADEISAWRSVTCVLLRSLQMLVYPVACANGHRCCRACYEEWSYHCLTDPDNVSVAD